MSLPGWFNDWNSAEPHSPNSVSPDSLWGGNNSWQSFSIDRQYEPFMNGAWNPMINNAPQVFSPPMLIPASPSPPPSDSTEPMVPDLAQLVLDVTEQPLDCEGGLTEQDPADPFVESTFVPVSGIASWSTAAVQTPPDYPSEDIEQQLTKQCLYKSELCRSFEETGKCRYGSKCQFAHGRAELRPVLRHPKYKTEVCKTFQATGHCPYSIRCRFIHVTSEDGQVVPPEENPASEDASRSRRRSKRRSRQKNSSSEKESKSRLSFFRQLVPTQ